MHFFRFYLLSIAIFLNFQSAHYLAASFVLDEIVNLESSYNEVTTTPNPIALHPQWWNYFSAEGDELKRRIAETNSSLQNAYKTLLPEDQTVAFPLINEITVSLNALPQARKSQTILPLNPRPLLKAYPLDKQLELYRQKRKLQGDIISEKERLIQLKDKLAIADKNIDNMMVAYLGQVQPSPKKLLRGLEIMAYRVNVGLGEQNVRLAAIRIEELSAKMVKLEEELEHSKQHLDVQGLNETELEKNIFLYQNELDNRQKALDFAEVNLLGVFNDNDRNTQSLLEQQALQASVNRAYAWTQLTFHKFKYNLVMHFKGRFHEGLEELRKNLGTWRESIAAMQHQGRNWRDAVLKAQERTRQEYAYLLSQNAQPESFQMRANKTLQEGVQSILTTLELLEEEVANTEWLINVLEEHFKKSSTFYENWWIDTLISVSKSWDKVNAIMNYSLFKVSGIPITPFTLLKILIILGLSFWLSLFVRSSLLTLGKTRKDITESTLYSLGSLAHYFILVIGFVIALCSIGLDFGNFVLIAGALTFGISFGLQSVANNFFCGLRILFERKLKIGDDIELHSGHSGKVSEIHVQNTVVRTSDGQKIIVPNSELVSNTLVNWTRHSHDYRRLHIPFAVSSDCDKELVRKVVIEAAKQVPCALKDMSEYAEPQVWLEKFSNHSLEFKLVVWVDYNGETYTDSKEADFLWEIETALRNHRIALPPSFSHFFSALKA